MTTILQKQLAEEIVKNAQLPPNKRKNKKELLVAAGYDETTAIATPTRTIEQKGVKDALREFGLTEELIACALVEDIKNKPQRRERELRLGAEILGMKSQDNSPTQNNFFLINADQLRKIAARTLNGDTAGPEQPHRLPDSDEPEVRA